MKILAGFVAKTFCYIIISLPKPIQYFLGDLLGWLWFDLFRIRRGVVINNLRLAFPELSEAERWSIGRKSLHNMGRDLIEYCQLPFLNQKKIETDFTFQGTEHIDRALGKGRGVCLLTLHMGNGDLALGALSLKGYPMYLISKEFKMKWLNEMWFNMRARLGTHFIPPRNSSYAVLKALKRKAVVTFVLDQFTGPPIGARTTFFGHETGTGLGLATIAERSKTPVVTCYTYRDSTGHTFIIFGPELEPVQGADRDESLVLTTQAYNNVLEEIVRKHPEQWMWIHRRWKRFVAL